MTRVIKSYKVKDNEDLDCPALAAASGECEKDLTGIGSQCLKSCNVYMGNKIIMKRFLATPTKKSYNKQVHR